MINQKIEDLFLSKLEESYHLVYTDYNCTLDNHPKLIESCIANNDCFPLWENETDWFADAQYDAIVEIIEEIQKELLSDDSLSEMKDDIIAWIGDNDNYDALRLNIEERDCSHPTEDILKRTNIRARVMLHTNYDCLMHNFDMGNTYEYGHYVKDIVDVLNLNPALVKQEFQKHGINAKGAWPNKPDRNGNEYVKYNEFADELANQSSYALLTFMGTMPLLDMCHNGFRAPSKITIPAGNLCGLFGDWNGGGSLMEMELLRDLTIDMSHPLTRGDATEYDTAHLYVDERGCKGYCIDAVYGMSYSEWREPLIMHYDNEQENESNAA